MHPTRVAPTSTSTHAPDRFAPDRFAARRTWNRGHVRGCPHNPLDWWRSLEMQALVRFTGKSLDELVAAARPGDLLLMSGRGVLAFVQEKFSASRWSHVGLVCRYRGELCVAHATPHGHGLARRLAEAFRRIVFAQVRIGHGANLLGGAGDVRVTPLHPFLREYLDDIGLDVALRRLAGLDETDAGAERDRVNAAIVATAEECRAMRFEPNAGAFVAVRYPALGALIALGLAGLAACRRRWCTTTTASSGAPTFTCAAILPPACSRRPRARRSSSSRRATSPRRRCTPCSTSRRATASRGPSRASSTARRRM